MSRFSYRWIFPVLFLIITTLLFTKCSEKVELSPLGEIPVHDDNLQSEAKIELGKKLFFDKRLSLDSTISCSSCHIPKWGFTDRRPLPLGVKGRSGFRNAPTLLNVAFQHTLMFDAKVPDLEQQAIVPIQDTNEMAISVGDLIQRLRNIPEYADAAEKVFQREFDAWVLTRSLAAFQRTLISDNSRFDRWYYEGEDDALTASEKNGWRLFSESLYCIACHPAPYFTNFGAENNGLYKNYGEDKGRFRIDMDSSEIGYFKVPTLRNIELTYPYMHDGSLETLEDVLYHYEQGGSHHPNQSDKVESFKLNDTERRDIIAFLKSLTDTSYLKRLDQ